MVLISRDRDGLALVEPVAWRLRASTTSRRGRLRRGAGVFVLTLFATVAMATGKASAGLFCPIGSGTVTLWNPSGTTEPWSCTRYQSGPVLLNQVQSVGQGYPYDNSCAGTRSTSDDFRNITSSNANIYAYACGGNTGATCGGGCFSNGDYGVFPFIKNSGGGKPSSDYWGYYS